MPREMTAQSGDDWPLYPLLWSWRQSHMAQALRDGSLFCDLHMGSVEVHLELVLLGRN